MSDCFIPEQRGKAIAMYSVTPLLGPALGPIAGGFIAENTSWRWIFYAISIADAVVQVSGIFFLSETYGPKILQSRAKKIRKRTQDNSFQTEVERQNLSVIRNVGNSLIRPFRLLTTQPIVQFLALYMAYVYGILYLVLSTFSSLWTSPAHYGESVAISGLNYISLAVGFWLGFQICVMFNDYIYRRFTRRNDNVGRPEFRTPLLSVATALIPSGLFIYGWSAQKNYHWIVPNIGAAIFGVGNIIAYQCIQTYLVDAYSRFTASALAGVVFMRSLCGFCFPLFAPYMYNTLDYAWGNSVLAFCSLGIGIPAPIVLWKFGQRLRKVSRYAAD